MGRLKCGIAALREARTWAELVPNRISPNKAFKSDSQRLAVSLRSSIAKRCSHLNAALGAD
ncbi:hypothetical protein DZA51_00880 [Vibrio campbellii]|nr:hypothetical protein DZA51_00880 [Vibrio campbellii]